MYNGQMPEPLVLVVEDDVLIRLDIADTLGRCGYRTAEAGSADEAVAILRTRSDIALVVTDVQMPGSMDGLGLARQIATRWPLIRLIVVSGHATPRAGELPTGSRFFQKPYNSRDLALAMDTMLAQ